MLRICSLFGLIILTSAGDSGATVRVQGPARLIDGDTLAIRDVVVRLHGIDAPEQDQTCPEAGGDWSCGLWSREHLGQLIAGGAVTCDVIETDRYGRAVARCQGPRGDLGEAMVAAGAAMAYREYSLAYVGHEERARQAGVGVWRAEGDGPQRPADWRAAAREAASAAEAVPAGCPIKGNISSSGRIFHSPGQQDYDSTRIDPSRGERWFCSEAEALAAGWRAARR
jgi:endonuclease YncB( thermonuclease family)